MKEIWKDIQGYEGLYQVSNLGRVRSLIFTNNFNKKVYKRIKVLKLEKTWQGYLRIMLSKNKIKKRYSVHRLVAKTFINNDKKYNYVNHKDENPSNNNVNNLEWCTMLYNNLYNGKNFRNCKRIAKLDLNNNILNIYDSVNEASNHNNINRCGISNCLNGRLKTSGNYKWKYYELDKIEDKKEEEEK